ncbi:MAG TPA: DNA-binding protein [Planctomycetaceae bacterium]|nr:DNA-binding protein [Planctomycetaceae bacterium]
MQKTLLTCREAALRLSVSTRTLWNWTARGWLPVVRIGRLTRYRPVDLERFALERLAGVEGRDDDAEA